MIKKSKALIATYSHPEYYPPTLNAITSLSELGFDITIVCNNMYLSKWEYPEGTNLMPLGKFMQARSFENIGFFSKIYRWLVFTNQVRKKLKTTTIFIAYDSIALFSFYIAKFFIWKPLPLIWYHNHDVIELTLVKKFSLSWFAARLEKKSFPYIDVFSLPTLDRKPFFPINKLKGDFFFLPNYPRLSFFSQFRLIQKEKKHFRILFQGSISPGHGIEEIIKILPLDVENKPTKLVLVGIANSEYKTELESLANTNETNNFLEIIDFTPYGRLPLITSTCHIGIAIFTSKDIMNSTLGTASNKIYEYIACGLPIIYYDSAYFRKYLGKYEWAIPTDLSPESLENAIHHIATNFDELSQKAIETFEKELNFEKYFAPIEAHLLELNADK